MFKFEKDLLNYIEKHLRIIVFIGITLAGFLIRASLRRFVSGDAACDLLPWYEQIKGAGGFQGVGEQVGTYNMLYQFLIAVMTYLPIKPLYAYKILSCVFDYLLALVAAWLIYDFSKKESVGSISREEFFSENLTLEKEKWKAVIVYGLIVLSPIVFINSALWAQCDAIYAFFIFISFLLFCKEKYAKSFIFYGIAVAFKLQAVFLLPFFLFVYFAKKNFSIIYFRIPRLRRKHASVILDAHSKALKPQVKILCYLENLYAQVETLPSRQHGDPPTDSSVIVQWRLGVSAAT